ncbi:predicted protein [Chaetoceros tenuissimus]|uniref:Uncharacterized protein n=1 Tax=Chaetoceros tenuissimus TaxID=426638 RepID=A0AAD3CII2_9STRA|nr:predicted protein [Chaetoceros tenuissimus]
MKLNETFEDDSLSVEAVDLRPKRKKRGEAPIESTETNRPQEEDIEIPKRIVYDLGNNVCDESQEKKSRRVQIFTAIACLAFVAVIVGLVALIFMIVMKRDERE